MFHSFNDYIDKYISVPSLVGRLPLGILGNALVIQYVTGISITILRNIYSHIFNSFILLRIGVLVVRIVSIIIIVIIIVMVMEMIMMIQMIQMMAIHFDVVGARDQCDAHRIEGLLEAELCVETAWRIIFGTNDDKWRVAAFNYLSRKRLSQVYAKPVRMYAFLGVGEWIKDH